MKKTSKKEATKLLEDFFLDIKNKSPREIKKIKKLAMSQNIPLKAKRKLFCKYCLHPYINEKIRIKKGYKIILCSNCGKVSRWKINSS